jgi:Ni/Co efflux regulator RcnB
MKKLLSLMIIAGLAFAPAISNAQDTSKPAKTKMDRRKAMKERWDNATPEQKEKAKEKAKEKKAKFDSLPPEQQKKIKDKMKARRERKNG